MYSVQFKITRDLKIILNSQKGFTLIEMILVVAIISILGALSATFYSRFLNQNAVANASDQLALQLRKAQVYSMVSKQGTNWGVKLQSGKIILYANGNSGFDESFSINPSTQISGFTQVQFTKGSGLPDQTPIILISDQNNQETISINTQGAVLR
jgi:prepilin-type N-terminal cleavage/methylation domain-containing protein